jgi:hypothetical protein
MRFTFTSSILIGIALSSSVFAISTIKVSEATFKLETHFNSGTQHFGEQINRGNKVSGNLTFDDTITQLLQDESVVTAIYDERIVRDDFTARAYIRGSENLIFGHADTLTEDRIDGANGFATVALNMSFHVKGVDSRLSFSSDYAGSPSQNRFLLTDKTAGISYTADYSRGDAFLFVPLVDGHRYEINAIVASLNTGTGDPWVDLSLHFGNDTIIRTPEAGSTAALMGIAIAVISVIRRQSSIDLR